MTNLIRTALLVVAVSFAGHQLAVAQIATKADFADTPAKSDPTPPADNKDLAAETPEVSGAVLASGFALVLGMAAMMPGRRHRTSTFIATR